MKLVYTISTILMLLTCLSFAEADTERETTRDIMQGLLETFPDDPDILDLIKQMDMDPQTEYL